jgi:Uncharacterized protein involved in cell differentiation/sexual development
VLKIGEVVVVNKKRKKKYLQLCIPYFLTPFLHTSLYNSRFIFYAYEFVEEDTRFR